MAIESLNTDNKISNITPVTPSISTQLPKDNVSVTNPSAVTIEKDATNLQASKGRIPTTSVFEAANAPAFEKSAISEVQKNANNKTQLQAYLTALDKLDLSKGIDSIDDKTLNELSSLGFDISEENGKIVVRDNKGNNISLEEFAKAQENIKNNVLRLLGSSEKVSSRPNSDPVVKPSNDTTAPKPMSEADQQKLLAVFKREGQAQNQIKTETEVSKAELESNLKEYDRMILQAQKKSEKVDMGISQILSLKSQADSLIQKGKVGSLSDLEKNQLKSLVTTMTLKQKELKNDQEASELLVRQIDTVFNQFSANLDPSEKSTKDNMQAALKAKISGQALTARQDFVASIQEEVYNLTKDMSPEEVNALMSDQNARMKLLAPVNKLLEKMNTAKSKSDFSEQEIETLKTKFNITLKEENGKLSFYHESKGVESKVSSDDLKGFRTDLNNIVKSPELFIISRAGGQISIAYKQDSLSEAKKDKEQEQDSEVSQYINVNKLNKEKKEEKIDNSSSKDKSNVSGENVEVIAEKQKKTLKMQEVSSLDKSIDKKREQEKYHQQQLTGILEKRREVNKFMENKRTETISSEKDTQRRIDLKDQEVRSISREIKSEKEN